MIRFIKEISKLNYFTKVLVCQFTGGLKINMDRPPTSLRPNILIAPLDWGLGHATRCIPIIHMLIEKNCNVLVACDEKIKALLHQEFPQLEFLHLKGYNINYSKNSRILPLRIGRQIPKILSTIQHENELLKEIVKQHNIHGIISDNRFGFFHSSIPSVFITHQLRIKTTLGKIGDDFLQKLNYNYINKFSKCWVPDNPGLYNLAGELSHPGIKPGVPLRYIGILSRFTRTVTVGLDHILILLSGPEPQRTILEEILTSELNNYKEPVVFVRGLPAQVNALALPRNVTVYNHLPAEELNKKINEASVIISRCGYSTVMDLAILKRKSILVPTPGQTEQQYLARYLMQRNFALCIDQEKFRLNHAMQLSDRFDYQLPDFLPAAGLDDAVNEFIRLVKIP